MDRLVCNFDKAQYLEGQEIVLFLSSPLPEAEIHVYRLHEEILLKTAAGSDRIILSDVPVGNYGVIVTDRNNRWEGAFDVVESPRKVTRYGFLSDFSSTDDDEKALLWMRDLHLNAVQFYDWMYRHDNFIAPSEKYLNPLGREISQNVVRRKLQLCRDLGMRSFAYGAVYAATKGCFQENPDWGMYTMDGQPMVFADWLQFMNISEDCGWSEHLLSEYDKAISFGFSGIHMDTYGFPKHVWDVEGRPIDLEQEFPRLINHAAQRVSKSDSGAGVIFNAVNDWPTETVAESLQDAVYIEVWPPNDSYFDLYTLIRKAKARTDKCVVLAAYMRPFLCEDQDGAEAALRLTWAAIFASGGTQLVLGERQAVLRDSYYANYATLRKSFTLTVQSYCDFVVRYADLLYYDKGGDISRTASGGINEDVCFCGENCLFSVDARADTVWTILRQSPHRLTVHMINLCGNDAQWNKPKERVRKLYGIRIRFRLDRKLKGVFAASPDGESLCALPLSVTYEATPQGRIYTAEIPVLMYWTVFWAEMEE